LSDVILTRAIALGGTLRNTWIGYTDVKNEELYAARAIPFTVVAPSADVGSLARLSPSSG